ncbi:MAG TPA: hypothetical protein VFT98_13345, partial [Myxococcota bacterium]|nr:hypothetical protein [Myxococcota bacterium]
MLFHLLELAVIAFGVFALLYPRSPLTLAMLRHHGPRLDFSRLLRNEIRESARGFASLALLTLTVMAAALIATEAAAPRTDAEKTPYYVCVLGLACLAGYFSFHSVRAFVAAWLRSARREDALLRERIPVAVAQELAGESLATWMAANGLKQLTAPPPPPPDLQRITGVQPELALLCLGGALLLGGVGIVYWQLVVEERIAADAARPIWLPVLIIA